MCVFFKQKTAYEMRISDWSSDVCSADLIPAASKIASTLPAFARRNGSCSTATVRLKKDSGPMTGKFNRAQRIVANIYGDGDFQHVRPGDRKRTRLNSSH